MNHCVAHIEMGRCLTGAPDPVVLYVSGGNTQVISYAEGRYRIFGETIDMAVGARRCARASPLERFLTRFGVGVRRQRAGQVRPRAGAQQRPGAGVQRGAAGEAGLRVCRGALLSPFLFSFQTTSNVHAPFCQLPYTVKGMDVSFSGMLTAAEGLAHRLKASHSRDAPAALQPPPFTAADLAFSFQETAFAALVEITERCMSHAGKRDVLLVGGVACNERLQAMAASMAAQRGGRSFGMDERYCIDNGAMVAYAGGLEWAANVAKGGGGGGTPLAETRCTQRFRTDEVQCVWRDD